jgi:trehalose-6-phosphatase
MLGTDDTRSLRTVCRGWAISSQQMLADRAAQGIVLEDKGVTLSLHYRHAPGSHRRRAAAR